MRVDNLTIEQQKAIRRKLKGEHRIIFDIGISTGLRISDILKLTVQQCISEHCYIKEQKTSKLRRIYIRKHIREQCKKIATETGKHGNMEMFNISRQAVWKAFKRATKRAKINTNVGTHSMRKSYSKNYINKGHTVFELQKKLNHSHLSDTVGYLTENATLGLDENGKPRKKKGKKDESRRTKAISRV